MHPTHQTNKTKKKNGEDETRNSVQHCHKTGGRVILIKYIAIVQAHRCEVEDMGHRL